MDHKTPENQLFVGANAQQPVSLNLRMANRHGLITGATGTGKTVTLQTLAEGFSRNGVPVFLADVKGDLSGLARAGGADEKVPTRVQELGLTDYQQRAYAVIVWELFAVRGHPVRTTSTNMGALLVTSLPELD